MRFLRKKELINQIISVFLRRIVHLSCAIWFPRGQRQNNYNLKEKV